MRTVLIALILCAITTACDQTNTAIPRPLGTSPNGLLFDDPDGNSRPTAAASLLSINTQLRSTSNDGGHADLSLFYTIDNSVADQVTGATKLIIDYINSDGQSRLISRVAANVTQLRDEIQISVPTDDLTATIRVSLSGLRDGIPNDKSMHKTVHLPTVITRQSTDLSLLISKPLLSLVEGSYSSQLLNGRRLHRFAIQVEGMIEGHSEAVSITGLENNVSNHFKAYEFDSIDPESSVTANYEEQNIAVYLVIDASSSIVSAGQAHNLIDAVSRSVISLAPNAEFDYRQFTNDIDRIGSLRELSFDEPGQSGTALYYGIDSALADIENFGSDDQDKVIVVFTDGDDRASRNFYPAFLSHAQVYDYLTQRIRSVKLAQQQLLGRQLQTFIVSFDQSAVEVDEQLLEGLASAGGGQHFDHISEGDIQGAFGRIVDDIRGVYYLEYSSQQTPDNTELELELTVGDFISDRIRLPTQ